MSWRFRNKKWKDLLYFFRNIYNNSLNIYQSFMKLFITLEFIFKLAEWFLVLERQLNPVCCLEILHCALSRTDRLIPLTESVGQGINGGCIGLYVQTQPFDHLQDEYRICRKRINSSNSRLISLQMNVECWWRNFTICML